MCLPEELPWDSGIPPASKMPKMSRVVTVLMFIFLPFIFLVYIGSHSIKNFRESNQRLLYAEIMTLPLASLLTLRMVNFVVGFLFAPECMRCWFEYCISGLDLRDGLELTTLDFLLIFCCLASWVTLTLDSVSKFQSTIIIEKLRLWYKPLFLLKLWRLLGFVKEI